MPDPCGGWVAAPWAGAAKVGRADHRGSPSGAATPRRVAHAGRAVNPGLPGRSPAGRDGPGRGGAAAGRMTKGEASCLPLLLCASRPPPHFRTGGLQDESPTLARPEGRNFRGPAASLLARPEAVGRLPAPGRDVSVAVAPAVTRNASGALLRLAATPPSAHDGVAIFDRSPGQKLVASSTRTPAVKTESTTPAGAARSMLHSGFGSGSTGVPSAATQVGPRTEAATTRAAAIVRPRRDLRATVILATSG